MTHGLYYFFKSSADHFILSSLTVFIDQSYLHEILLFQTPQQSAAEILLRLTWCEVFILFLISCVNAQALLGLFADVSKDTAIYIEDVSIDCIGCLRSKEYSGAGQLFGL